MDPLLQPSGRTYSGSRSRGYNPASGYNYSNARLQLLSDWPGCYKNSSVDSSAGIITALSTGHDFIVDGYYRCTSNIPINNTDLRLSGIGAKIYLDGVNAGLSFVDTTATQSGNYSVNISGIRFYTSALVTSAINLSWRLVPFAFGDYGSISSCSFLVDDPYSTAGYENAITLENSHNFTADNIKAFHRINNAIGSVVKLKGQCLITKLPGLVASYFDKGVEFDGLDCTSVNLSSVVNVAPGQTFTTATGSGIVAARYAATNWHGVFVESGTISSGQTFTTSGGGSGTVSATGAHVVNSEGVYISNGEMVGVNNGIVAESPANSINAILGVKVSDYHINVIGPGRAIKLHYAINCDLNAVTMYINDASAIGLDCKGVPLLTCDGLTVQGLTIPIGKGATFGKFDVSAPTGIVVQNSDTWTLGGGTFSGLALGIEGDGTNTNYVIRDPRFNACTTNSSGIVVL